MSKNSEIEAVEGDGWTVLQLIAPARNSMILSALCTALGALFALLPYIALTQIAILWTQSYNTHAIGLWIALAGVASALHLFFYGLGMRISHHAEARLRYQLRQQLVVKMTRLPLGSVADMAYGRLRQMIVDETSALHTLVAHVAGDVANSVVGLIGGLLVLLWADWRLALLLLLLWVGIAWLIYQQGMKHYHALASDYGAAQSELAIACAEMLEGIQELRNFQHQSAGYPRFVMARKRLADISYLWIRQAGKAMAYLAAFFKPAVVLGMLTPLALLFFTAGWTDMAHLLPFFLIALGIPAGLGNLSVLLQSIYEAQMAAHSVSALLSQAEIQDGEKSSTQAASIELRSVDFSYDGQTPVLRQVSFTAEAGKVTALVGASGSGKSTIAKLIARFYDVDAGGVYVAGLDVREWQQEVLLQNMAFVFQEVALAHDSVVNNLNLGGEPFQREELEAAAKAAQIHERIMRLPQGYDTILDEEAGFLSGGEKQRLTLARAYLRHSPIVILDEATANSDPQAECFMYQALQEIRQSCTVIIVAHRLSRIATADRIIVLDEGVVVESGTHEDLLAQKGQYAQLWQKQNGEKSC